MCSCLDNPMAPILVYGFVAMAAGFNTYFLHPETKVVTFVLIVILHNSYFYTKKYNVFVVHTSPIFLHFF